MIKRSTFILCVSVASLVLVAALWVTLTPRSDSYKPPVTVGGWNLEWLGQPAERDGIPPRTVEDLRFIAVTIGDILDLEVVVLVEIDTASNEWATLKTALASRGFKFIEGSGGVRRVVIAYDSAEVQLLSPPESAEPQVRTAFSRGDCQTGDGRKPLFATFRAGKFDFTVVGVHLRSGYSPAACFDHTFDDFVRQEQADDILREIERRERAGMIDRDIMIVGDFNDSLESAALEKFRSGGYYFLTEEANRSSSSGLISYRSVHRRKAVDHIAIRHITDRNWISRSTMYLPALSTMTDPEFDLFRQRFSDHSPFWTDFRTDSPDK